MTDGDGGMPLHRAPLLPWGAALASFALGALCGPPSNSLCYFYLQLPEPSQGLPPSFIRSYLDDQPIARFDSLTRKMEPLVPWMKEVEKRKFLVLERVFRIDLEKLSQLSHLTGGLNTWQVIWGCELREDGSKGGFLHYGYNGMDFISFDKETLRWVAAQPQAQKVKEKWEEDSGWSQRNKVNLEETCIEWLQRYLSYKNKTLQRTEPPVGKVTYKVINDSLKVLICQAFGFYPKEIQATWRRDGEVWKNETLQRNVAPNSDGTYYVWLSSEIDPKERHHFQCQLEHKGLQEPLVLAWKEETAGTRWIPLGIVAALILGLGILFLIGRWWRCRQNVSQQVKSCSDPIPSEMADFSPVHGREDQCQPQTMLQPEVTIQPKATCGAWELQSVLRATLPSLSRQEGLQRQNSWAGELLVQAEAGATESAVRMIKEPVESLGSLFQGPGGSEGFYSWQSGINCELSEDGHKPGSYQNVCDVEDFISLGWNSCSWTVADLHAPVTKKKWEAEPKLKEQVAALQREPLLEDEYQERPPPDPRGQRGRFSTGFYSWQNGINCELSEDDHKPGSYQNVCDVEDFISLDQAQI